MSFTLDDRWVWDFWLAEADGLHHLYYLSAPRSLGDPDLRHRNATIGHATSADLVTWTDLGTVLTPGDPDAFDGTSTWTGSVVRATDDTWYLFYTGARFLHPTAITNVETVGLATSSDLHVWTKQPSVELSADPRWYEVLADGSWREEAWRDPWVYPDPSGDGWHMLVTGRGRSGSFDDRGVIGHATSPDLRAWAVREPLSTTGSGFMHLEVPQLVDIDGRTVLLFSCDTQHLAGWRAEAGQHGGIFALPVDDVRGPFNTDLATLLTEDSYYSGRAVRRASDGAWTLLAFENVGDDGEFVGRLSDPLPLGWNGDGQLAIRKES